MNRVSDRTLAALLAGALDPGEADRLGERLAIDPGLGARLDRIAREITPLTPPDRWTLPPPRLPIQHPAAAFSAHVAVAGPTPAPGDPVEIRVGPVADPGAWQVAVVRGDGLAWEILAPTGPGDRLALTDLEEAPGGGRRIVVTVQPSPRVQRWGVILHQREIDWSAGDPWGAVRAGAARGDLPAFTAEVALAEG